MNIAIKTPYVTIHTYDEYMVCMYCGTYCSYNDDIYDKVNMVNNKKGVIEELICSRCCDKEKNSIICVDGIEKDNFDRAEHVRIMECSKCDQDFIDYDKKIYKHKCRYLRFPNVGSPYNVKLLIKLICKIKNLSVQIQRKTLKYYFCKK